VILADLIALTHAALVALIVGGALVALTPRAVSRFPRSLAIAYLLAVGATLASDLAFGECLLTRWERHLRGQAGFPETFLQHHFAFLPDIVTRPESFVPVFGCVLAVTAWAILQRRRFRG
jgi:hypothetical protein